MNSALMYLLEEIRTGSFGADPMPVYTDLIDAMTKMRTDLIRQRYEAGTHTVTDMIEPSGLSRSRIYQLLEKQEMVDSGLEHP